ncbi:MAG: single-stranded-DNA-specific exonuclease RecJ [Bacteroidetes bacterium]|nr:MAG: single-stranded-DNA-specific exonuclease RecJ [Bacteroidota bacterium]
MDKRWNILETDANKVAALHAELKIHPVLCQVLVQRQIETFNQAKEFFRPQITDLLDPWLMKDMDKAVERIFEAFSNNEKILVYGDYDVDGTTSVACMYQFLQKIYHRHLLDFYIPHRHREGYGVSQLGVEFARENGYTLIISLDCGIKSVTLIEYARSLGIDFIVCDHHLPDATLPPAVAILNPKQVDCPYPYKELCGCGVGFKLITAISQHLGLPEEDYYCYLDLVATAIAADIVPMTRENRVLAYYGLKKVNEKPNNGIHALIHLSAVKRPLLINNLVFMIAPRVNAAGRMDDAKKAVQMFIARTYEEALTYAEMLHSDNSERKETDSSITEEALAIIEKDEILVNRKSTVVFQSHWHKGVVGIVASRLIEKYYRPTVVLTQSGEVVSGSARSVSGFNLYEAIHACREHLLGYGGHFAAAGMTLLPEQVPLFSAKFEEIVSATIQPKHLVPEINIDAIVALKDLNPIFFKILKQMEPFGPGNMKPIFIASNVVDSGYSRIVKEMHIRFSLKQDNVLMGGIGFNLADKFPIVHSGKPFDILFTLDENEWNGEKSLQMKVIDLRESMASRQLTGVSSQKPSDLYASGSDF